MLQVQGPDPGIVSRRLAHHGEKLRPIIDALVYSLLLESEIARDDNVHVLRQSKNGPGSFGLYLSDGRQFHFRLGWQVGHEPYMTVRDAFQNGTEVAKFTKESQARWWARTLTLRQAKKRAA